jgi:hypothetical protein
MPKLPTPSFCPESLLMELESMAAALGDVLLPMLSLLLLEGIPSTFLLREENCTELARMQCSTQ